jgi:hypothetical protein
MKCHLISAGVALALLLATPSASLAQRQPPQQPQQPQTFRVMPFNEPIECYWGSPTTFDYETGQIFAYEVRQLRARNTLQRPLPAGTRVRGWIPDMPTMAPQRILVEPLLPEQNISFDVEIPWNLPIPDCHGRAVYP